MSEPQTPQQPYFSTKTELPRAKLAMVLGIVSIALTLPAPFIGTTIIGIAGIICAGSALMIVTEARTIYNERPELYVDSSLKTLRIARITSIIGVCIHFFMFALFWVFIIFFGHPFFAL